MFLVSIKLAVRILHSENLPTLINEIDITSNVSATEVIIIDFKYVLDSHSLKHWEPDYIIHSLNNRRRKLKLYNTHTRKVTLLCSHTRRTCPDEMNRLRSFCDDLHPHGAATQYYIDAGHRVGARRVGVKGVGVPTSHSHRYCLKYGRYVITFLHYFDNSCGMSCTDVIEYLRVYIVHCTSM